MINQIIDYTIILWSVIVLTQNQLGMSLTNVYKILYLFFPVTVEVRSLQYKSQYLTFNLHKYIEIGSHFILEWREYFEDSECRMSFKYLSQFHSALVDVRFPR